jgi:hypothetical protein
LVRHLLLSEPETFPVGVNTAESQYFSPVLSTNVRENPVPLSAFSDHVRPAASGE